MLGWLAAVAAATTVGDTGTCGVASFAGSLPSANATDVPTDVVPAVWLSRGCDVSATVDLLDSAGGLLASHPFAGGALASGDLFERIDFGVSFEPQSAYVLRVTTFEEITDVPFVTGDGPSDGVPPAPPTVELAVTPATWSGPVLLVPATLTVRDYPADCLLLFEDALVAPDRPTYTRDVYRTVQPGVDLCEEVVVQDLVGSTSAVGRACVQVDVPARNDGDEDDDEALDDGGRGCATVPGSAASGAFVAGLILSVCRRRSTR